MALDTFSTAYQYQPQQPPPQNPQGGYQPQQPPPPGYPQQPPPGYQQPPPGYPPPYPYMQPPQQKNNTSRNCLIGAVVGVVLCCFACVGLAFIGGFTTADLNLAFNGQDYEGDDFNVRYPGDWEEAEAPFYDILFVSRDEIGDALQGEFEIDDFQSDDAVIGIIYLGDESDLPTIDNPEDALEQFGDSLAGEGWDLDSINTDDIGTLTGARRTFTYEAEGETGKGILVVIEIDNEYILMLGITLEENYDDLEDMFLAVAKTITLN